MSGLHQRVGKPRILVVEDDTSISLGLRMSLEGAGYDVTLAEDGEAGLKYALEGAYDLLVLDLMLPKLNGYELLSAFREQSKDTPVMMLSAKSGDLDKVMGLDLGADDYVTKPFSVSELLARVRVMLRRTTDNASPSSSWEFGDVLVKDATREVIRGGAIVDLTATEFDVLKALLEAQGRILTRRQLLDAVWGDGHKGTERTIDNFLAQLRAKLEVDPAQPQYLITVRGVGYRFAAS